MVRIVTSCEIYRVDSTVKAVNDKVKKAKENFIEIKNATISIRQNPKYDDYLYKDRLLKQVFIKKESILSIENWE